ncbi:MAG: nitroreductase family protein [Kofleriaceae bacterium]
MTNDSSLSALDAIFQRHATRAYTSERVDRETIMLLLRAAVHAPTAMHLEPWAFAVVQDRALLKRISEHAKAIVQTPRGADHRELARTPNRAIAMLSDPAFNIFYDASTLIVICGKPLGPFVVADCWLAAENLMIAATALGYATCPIGFAVPALADPEIRAELAIPADVTAYAPIIVGRAATAVPAQDRREPDILCWKE